MRSNNLEKTDSTEMGLWFVNSRLSPDLNTGVTLAFFSSSGKNSV